MGSLNKSQTLLAFLLLLVSQTVLGQYENEEYEESEEEAEAGEIDVATKVKAKVTTPNEDLMKLNFTEQFNMLTSTKNVSTTFPKANATTKRPSPARRTTTELTRVEEIGSSVNGILNSAGTLDIPAIVDNALAIRNNEPVRKLVNGIMNSIFCSPVLNLLSSCGRKRIAANLNRIMQQAQEEANPRPKNATSSTTTTAPVTNKR